MALTGWKNAAGGLLLLAGLGALVGVPALVAAPLPREGPPLSAERIPIGFGASIVPPPGSRLDLGDSRPGAGAVTVRADGVELRLTTVEFPGAAGPFVAHTRHKFDRDELLVPDGPPEPVRTASGISGERGSLRGGYDGERACYAVLTGHSVGVVFLAAPVTGCAELSEPVRAALTSIEIAATGAW